MDERERGGDNSCAFRHVVTLRYCGEAPRLDCEDFCEIRKGRNDIKEVLYNDNVEMTRLQDSTYNALARTRVACPPHGRGGNEGGG